MEKSEPSEFIIAVIDKYYPVGTLRQSIYMQHVRAVADACASIIAHNQSISVDYQLMIDGAFVHDLGICMTNASDLDCQGSSPYIQHGILGRDMLIKEGLEKYAPFCERHVGVGLSKEFAAEHGFPQPHIDMFPITVEEQIVCFADKFFSKSLQNLSKPKPLEKIVDGIRKFGQRDLDTFLTWCNCFGTDYLYK